MIFNGYSRRHNGGRLEENRTSGQASPSFLGDFRSQNWAIAQLPYKGIVAIM